MERGQSGSEYEPNFTLPQRDAVNERNWEAYDARGYRILWEAIEDPELFELQWEQAQTEFGAANVFSGDAFDWDSERPLRHKPGRAIYVSAAGVQYQQERRRSKPRAAQPPR